MTIGIYLLKCYHSDYTLGMATIRRRKRGLQVAIASIVLLSFSPILVLVISRDPTLSPFSDRGAEGQVNENGIQQINSDSNNRVERIIYETKVRLCLLNFELCTETSKTPKMLDAKVPNALPSNFACLTLLTLKSNLHPSTIFAKLHRASRHIFFC